MQSLGKYNLSCYASESQLQEYTSGNFREVLARPREEDEWAIQLAVKAVGLQEIKEDDPTVEEMGLNPKAKVWVLNSSIDISEWGTPVHPANSPFIWLGKL